MSILIAGYTNDKKDYCLELYVRQLLSFSYPSYDAFIVDNSKSLCHIEKLWECGIDSVRVEPEGSPSEYICQSQNIIRDKVLYEGFEWLFLLDSDVFVPLNTLEYLMIYGNPVHTFAYFLDDNCSAVCLDTLMKLQDRRGVRLDAVTGEYKLQEKAEPINEHRMGMPFDVYATGLGCTLIHRDILKEVSFRIDENNKGVFSDSYFFKDLKRLGVRPVIDTNIIPAHYRSEHFLTDLKIYQ